ncbi:hypothetical protein ILYODFUR_028555 [Ilyodon furcidens]|uniref:Uncharacterized protein n=1 Tax=Ilyodon furcidens TaxID=33524 RepID=A0ABV0T4Q7_9TELE
MMLLLEEKKGGKGEKEGWGCGCGSDEMKRGGSSPCRAWNTSGPPARQKGHRATELYILLTREPLLRPEPVQLQYGSTALSHILPFTLTVYTHHTGDMQSIL